MHPNSQRGSASSGTRPNSVNLGSQELDLLLDRMDGAESNKPPAGHTKRRFVRWPFRQETLLIRLCHPAGTEVLLRVACRNISRGGMSVLHSSFVHPGSECTIMLPRPGKAPVETPGRIVRCMHRAGVVHEVGIAFKTPIRVRDFLTHDPQSQYLSFERVDPGILSGSVVLVAASTMDRQMILYYLRETKLRINAVGTVAEAAHVCAPADVVIALTPGQATESRALVTTLRGSGFKGQFVLVVPDGAPQARAAVSGLGVSVVLTQPVTQDLLTRALGEILVRDPSADYTQHRAQAAEEPGVAGLIAELQGFGHGLQQALADEDLALVRKLCTQIRDVAEVLHWSSLVDLTKQVLVPIKNGHGLNQVAAPIQTLASACTLTGPAAL